MKLSEVGRVVGNRLEILSGLEFPAFSTSPRLWEISMVKRKELLPQRKEFGTDISGQLVHSNLSDTVSFVSLSMPRPLFTSIRQISNPELCPAPSKDMVDDGRKS